MGTAAVSYHIVPAPQPAWRDLVDCFFGEVEVHGNADHSHGPLHGAGQMHVTSAHLRLLARGSTGSQSRGLPNENSGKDATRCPAHSHIPFNLAHDPSWAAGTGSTILSLNWRDFVPKSVRVVPRSHLRCCGALLYGFSIGRNVTAPIWTAWSRAFRGRTFRYHLSRHARWRVGMMQARALGPSPREE